MKSVLKLGLIAALGSVGSLAVVSEAQAVNANHSGTICKNYNAGDVGDIDYVTSGTRNLNANPRFVICPLVRSPTTDSSIAAYVDGNHFGVQTTSCTLYSYNYTGAFLGSTSFTRNQSGAWDQFVSLPAPQAPFYGSLAVLCTIPGSANGVLLDVDVLQ